MVGFRPLKKTFLKSFHLSHFHLLPHRPGLFTHILPPPHLDLLLPPLLLNDIDLEPRLYKNASPLIFYLPTAFLKCLFDVFGFRNWIGKGY